MQEVGAFPMMRRLLDADVKPTVSYGCEVWGEICSGSLQPRLKAIVGFQVAFLRQHLKLGMGISLHMVFVELVE